MFESENNIENLFNESSKELNGLEAAFSEPFVERVLEMGRTYNEIFKEIPPTEEERAYIIQELDIEWGTIKGTIIKYTGNVKVKDRDDEGEVRIIFIDGAEVVSNGFYIEPEYANGRELQKVKHHLFVKFNDLYGDESGEDNGNLAGATGDIDSSSIELDSASAERARAWLTISCPELIEEIDLRVLNAAGGEDDAIVSLRGFDLSIYPELSDDFTRNCLTIYLQKVVEIDLYAPYSTKLDGYARMLDDQSNLYTLKIDGALVYINHLILHPTFNLDETDTAWSLATVITVLDEDRTEDPEQYIVPIDTFKELHSIRSAFYETNS
ncbi:MAG: hypothetical protein JWO54_505 [Candidatus Saccharibacteria bacterium]|nr:hypothetical protein [Candidatus Saccharibacteria bacterium]MDB5180745.1 hypothetical protein [Candidatus Saccharibacteria bacterium]